MNVVLSSAAELDTVPLSRFFRALGDETRLRIVALLAHGELCVCHLEQALGLSQPNASRQLGILKAAGIVASRRDGSWVYYAIAAQPSETARQLLATLTTTFATEHALRIDHAKLRESFGPDARK